MQILLTGANSNIGTGLIPLLLAQGHSVVLSDLNPPVHQQDLPFFQCDIQHGFGLERAAEGCDLLLHLPAWHGIHWNQKTELDYWRLNVDGTALAFQAAKSAGVKRTVFLSSQAWHGHYDKYGFTKRIGEELCEYHRRNSDIGYVAVRPADLTPFGSDYLNRFGSGMLYGRVHRADVLNAVVKSVQWLENPAEGEVPSLIVDATRGNAFSAEQIEGWEQNPVQTAERIWPGSSKLIEKYELKISSKPHLISSFLGWSELGYEPGYHFGTFLEELRRLDASLGEEGVRALRCDY